MQLSPADAPKRGVERGCSPPFHQKSLFGRRQQHAEAMIEITAEDLSI
jgi:hypothetical protein